MLTLTAPQLIVCATTSDQHQLAQDYLRNISKSASISFDHPSVNLFDGRESGLKIEEVRQLAQAVQYQPIDGTTWIIVLGLDNASLPAQQALLKLLEEPPSYVQWLLFTHQLARVLPTIQSRCIAIDLTQTQNGLDETSLQRATELLQKITQSSVGDLIALSDTFSDRAKTTSQLQELVLYLHALPPTPSRVRQIQMILETQKSVAANANLKLAVGECFLTLRKV